MSGKKITKPINIDLGKEYIDGYELLLIAIVKQAVNNIREYKHSLNKEDKRMGISEYRNIYQARNDIKWIYEHFEKVYNELEKELLKEGVSIGKWKE